MCRSSLCLILLCAVLVALPLRADEPGTFPLSPGLIRALDTLNGTNSVNDGISDLFTPARAVSGQNTKLSYNSTSLGASIPVWQTPADVFFANVSVKAVSFYSDAILPTDRKPLPGRFWDVELGGTYLKKIVDDWTVGISFGMGSASDRPFESPRDATWSALAFLRIPYSERDAGLFYVLSQTNGQFGRNIPIPGMAYEFERDSFRGIIGFPFASLTVLPFEHFDVTASYAPLTDVQAIATYAFTDNWKISSGFIWDNQSWFWSGRKQFRNDLLFLYEKRLESAVRYQVTDRIECRLTGGYAFDRFFVENRGFSLHGRNRMDLGSGPYTSLMIHFTY